MPIPATANFSFFNAAEPDLENSKVMFKTASDFSQFVELTAVQKKITCTAVIIDYCEDKDIDLDEIAKLISRPLREKIAMEMQDDGLMPRSSTLPFE